eukprot:gene7929-8748_t
MTHVGRNFEAIEGVRTVFSVWIVSLHISLILKWLCYAGDPPRPDGLSELSTSAWAVFSQGQGIQVDVFFMLSGFLLINNLLEKDKGYVTDSPIRDLVMMLARRLLRLWPALLVAIGLTCWLRDYHDDWWTLATTLAFSLGRHQPIAFVVNWSTRMDIQCSIILFAVFYLLKRTKTLSFGSSCLVAILSILPKFYNFFFRRELVSYLSLRMTTDDNRYLPVFMHKDRQSYHVSQGLELSFVHDLGDLYRIVFAHDYHVFYQRFTPFFIGMALAMALKSSAEHGSEPVESHSSPAHSAEAANHKTPPPQLKKADSLNSLWHGLCLVLTSIVVISPALLSFAAKKSATVSLTAGQLPPFFLDLFVSVIYRSLYALGLAYVLYRCLLPHDHPLRLSMLSKVLSSWPLKNLGVYSYGVYTIHMRVMMEVTLKILPLPMLDGIFGTEAVFIKYLTWLLVTYALSLGISLFTHHCVEAAFAKLVTRNCLSWLHSLLHKSSIVRHKTKPE